MAITTTIIAYNKIMEQIPFYLRLIKVYMRTNLHGTIEIRKAIIRFNPKPLLKLIENEEKGPSFNGYPLMAYRFVLAHSGLADIEETLNILTAARMSHKDPIMRKTAKMFMIILDNMEPISENESRDLPKIKIEIY